MNKVTHSMFIEHEKEHLAGAKIIFPVRNHFDDDRCDSAHTVDHACPRATNQPVNNTNF